MWKTISTGIGKKLTLHQWIIKRRYLLILTLSIRIKGFQLLQLLYLINRSFKQSYDLKTTVLLLNFFIGTTIDLKDPSIYVLYSGAPGTTFSLPSGGNIDGSI